MEDFIKSIFDFLIANYALYVVVVMGALMTIIYFILNFAKKPIKKLTGKIQNEQLRHLANKSIILLSFGFATLFWFLLSFLLPKYFDFDGVEILLTGALPVVLYAFVEGLSKPKAKKIVDTIIEIVDDGKIDKKEVEELNSLAENELDNLLK